MGNSLKRIAIPIVVSAVLAMATFGAYSVVPMTAQATTSTITYNNNVFTKTLKSKVKKVHFDRDGVYVKSTTSKLKIRKIYKTLASLKLKSVSKKKATAGGLGYCGGTEIKLYKSKGKVLVEIAGGYMNIKTNGHWEYYKPNHDPETKIIKILKS